MSNGIFINQGQYVKDLLKKYKLDEVKHASTVVALNTTFDIDQSYKPVSKKGYRGAISSLLYLTTSRLDIMFSECFCARFQSPLKESHLEMAIKPEPI